MKKYFKKLLSYSVYRKTLIAYSVSILIITVLILTSMYGIFVVTIKNYSMETTQQLLNQLVSGTSIIKTNIDNVLSVITNDSRTLKFINNNSENKQDNYFLLLNLQEIKSSYPFIEDISVINFDSNVCINTIGSEDVDKDNIDFIYSLLEQQKYIVIRRTIMLSQQYKNVVSFLQYLPYNNATVVVDVDADWFQYSINKNGNDKRSVFIIDHDGNAISNNTQTEIDDQPLSTYFYSIISLQNGEKDNFVYDDKIKKQMIFFSLSPEFGWWFIDVQDYSYFNSEFEKVSFVYIGISLAFLIFCVIIAIIFNKRINKPLIQLVNKCRNMAGMEVNHDLDELQYLDIAIQRGKHERYINQNYFREQFIKCLILGQQMPFVIPRIELDNLRDQYHANHYCIMLLKIKNMFPLMETQLEEFKIFRFTICNLSDEIFKQGFSCKAVDVGEDIVGILFLLDKKTISEDYFLYFKQLKEFAEERIHITVSGSLGLIVEDQKDIVSSYQKAKQYLEMNQLIGYDMIDSNNLISISYQEKNKKLVESIIEYTEINFTNPDLSLKNISYVFGLSTTYLGKIFKSIHGEAYASFVTGYRLEKTKVSLVETMKTMNEIAVENGFTNSTYYATIFKSIYGMTPTEFRNKAKSFM